MLSPSCAHLRLASVKLKKPGIAVEARTSTSFVSHYGTSETIQKAVVQSKMVVITRLGPPEEGVRHKQESTDAYVNQKLLGKGTLYISEARVSWVGDAGQGFSLEYPHIALHAVSKDLVHFHSECLYLMIDVRLVDSDGTPTPSSTSENEDDDASSNHSDEGMTEIRFVPEDKSKLEEMFQAMSACQALHPDPADNSEDEDAGEEEEEEEGDDENGDGNGDHQGEGDAEEGMFDDADEDVQGQAMEH